MSRVWTMLLRPGKDCSYTKDCMQDGTIVIGWGTGTDVPSKDDDYYRLREEIKQQYYFEKTDYRSAGQATGMVWTFCTEMLKGDLVIVPVEGYKFYLGRLNADDILYKNDMYYRGIEWILAENNPGNWENAPVALSKACRTRSSLKNSDGALGELQKVLADPKYLEETWEVDLIGKLKATISKYHQEGRINFYTLQSKIVPRILQCMGATKIENRSGEGDKGIDNVATFPGPGGLTDTLVGVQVKHYEPDPPLTLEVIDETLHGAVCEGVDQAWIVTTGTILDCKV